MIETIITSVVKLASTIADAVASRRKPKLDPKLERLESEKIIDQMLARARAMAEAEKARKRLEKDGK